MRTYIRLAFFWATAVSLHAAATPVLAQGTSYQSASTPGPRYSQTAGQYDTSGLPHVKFFNARRKLDVVNEGPEWNNCIDTPAPSTNYDGLQIPIAVPTGAGHGGAGGGSGALPQGMYPAGTFPLGIGMGNPMVSSRDSLPKSRLGPSNINQSALHPVSSLPDGRTTGIHGRMAAAAPQSGPTTIRFGHPTPVRTQPANTNQPIFSYNPAANTSVGSGSGSSVNTGVHAVLKTLLQKQKP